VYFSLPCQEPFSCCLRNELGSSQVSGVASVELRVVADCSSARTDADSG
jgi:hypothetical protein